MTTESKHHRAGVSPLLGSVVVSLVATGVLTGLGAILGGAPAARGAAAGAVATLVTFAWGVGIVAFVARVMPSASMMIALLTYALQVMLMGVLALAMMQLSDGGSYMTPGWIAAGIVTLVLVWMAAQVWWTTRLRTLAYDLDAPSPRPGPEAGE